MKYLWKKLAAGAAVLAVTAAVAVMPAMAAVTLPDLPADQCVVDDAGVLSDSVTDYLDQLNGQLEASCNGAQIGVLTVQYTGSASTEEYALEAFNTWGIGSSANNGVLILLVMESPLYADGDYYLTYGDGFRNTTLDRQASTLAQTMEDDFAAKDYDGAVETCADAVASTIADIYGVNLSSGGTAAAPSEGGGFMINLGAIVIALALLVVMVILVFGPILNGMFPFCFGFGLGSAFRGPRYHHHYHHHMPPPPPPYRPRGPRGPRPPRGGGFGGGFGGFGGGGFGGGGFGGMGGGSSHGGGGGRGR